MDNQEFRDWSRRAADWGADYRANLRDRPVRPAIAPGEIFRSIEASPPETAEPMEKIFADFEAKIVPGMTHWQHPRFFAYFPANASPPSVVAEYVTAAVSHRTRAPNHWGAPGGMPPSPPRPHGP